MKGADSRTFTAAEICERVGGELEGPADVVIRGVDTLDAAEPGQISFIGEKRRVRDWECSGASAALVSRHLPVPADHDPVKGQRTLIRVVNADLAVAVVSEMFAPPVPTVARGVHPSVELGPSVSLGDDVGIGPNSVIGQGTRVGDGTTIHANVTVLDGVTLGARCVLWPGVVIRENCEIGDDCIFHPGVVIGSDGFGYRPSPDGRSIVKIPQIGHVIIGRNVEIGACTCIDRGKFSATRIGDETKIDNLCQIAHSCQIGRRCLIAAQCGIAGSVKIGDGVILAGKVGLKDHITVGDGAQVGGYSGVMADMPPGAKWFGIPAVGSRKYFRMVSVMRRLPDLVKQINKLTRQ